MGCLWEGTRRPKKHEATIVKQDVKRVKSKQAKLYVLIQMG